MIEKKDAMQILVDACPSFRESWSAHVGEHRNDLLYVAAGEFASHLLLLQEGQVISELRAVGKAIERLHVEGDSWVKEFATIGVLEGIQNAWSHSAADLQSFVSYLGPESLRWWNGVNEFWQGKVPYVRAEG